MTSHLSHTKNIVDQISGVVQINYYGTVLIMTKNYNN